MCFFTQYRRRTATGPRWTPCSAPPRGRTDLGLWGWSSPAPTTTGPRACEAASGAAASRLSRTRTKPSSAGCPGALEYADVDHCLPLEKIAPFLVRLSREPAVGKVEETASPQGRGTGILEQVSAKRCVHYCALAGAYFGPWSYISGANPRSPTVWYLRRGAGALPRFSVCVCRTRSLCGSPTRTCRGRKTTT
jgi:hypothetical protein